MWSDYQFLEEVTKAKTKAENLSRDKRLTYSSTSRRRLPRSLYVLSTNARRLGIEIEFLPSFMTKRKENTTRFDIVYGSALLRKKLCHFLQYSEKRT